MHTFFINTSDKNVDEGKILFDINYENRTLVALKCRIEDWTDKEKGYLACVEKMSEMMDMYDDMNKQFNLIIYINLSAMRKEALEQDTMANDYRGYMEALSIVYCRVMRNTIINALECRSRSPREILIMFGTEEKRIYGADISSPYENDLVIEPLRLFIGLPPDKDIFKLHDDIVSPEHNDEGKMSKALAESCKKNAEYFSAAEIFAEEFLEYCRKAETSCDQEEIHEEYLSFVRTAVSNNQKSRNGTRINAILCPLDNEAEADNKAARTLNSLRIACYILACVYDGTIFDNNTEQKELRSFDALSIEKITEALAEKRSEYVYALISLNEMSSRFSELELTPVLYSFKGNVFDYNEDGDAISCSVERPVGESKKKKKAEREKRRKKENISEMEDGRVIESVKRERKNLLKERKVEYFSHAENFSESPEISETAGEYIMHCERLKDFQLGFLKKAQNHILGILSHYAGKSENNTKAILPKRRVSLADPDGGDETRENSYTASKLPEEREIENVERTAKKIYNGAVKEYLMFEARGPLAEIDISRQCDWFATRIRNIESSKKMLKVMFGVLTGLLTVSCVPYIAVQWDVIKASAESALVAAATVLLPLLLLTGLYVLESARYKYKYRQAWLELMEKYQEIQQGNLESIENYDMLICKTIPTLRWTYEYKLDVDFFKQCCSYASAKIVHHKKKLKERVNGIGNLLDNLGAKENRRASYDSVESARDTIEFNEAYCCGEKNIAFYTVIDQNFINGLYSKRRKDA